MATNKLLPILPFARPLPHHEFKLARQEACAIYKSNGGAITTAEIDELAGRHSKDPTRRIAIASSIHDYLVSFGTASAPSPVNSQAAIKHAGLIHDVYRGELNRAGIADKHGVHEKHMPRIMRDAGHLWNGRRRRWEPLDADRHHKAAKGKLKAHRAWVKANKALCHWVSIPAGKVDLGAICEVQNGVCLQSGKINLRHIGHGIGTMDAHWRSWHVAGGNYLMQTANYLALNPKAMAHLLSEKVTLELVNGYPAIVFSNGQRVFLHTRNYMVAHGVISLPGNTHLHHIDGNPLNAAPRNIVATFSQEHHALHSRKG